MHKDEIFLKELLENKEMVFNNVENVKWAGQSNKKCEWIELLFLFIIVANNNLQKDSTDFLE